MFKLTLSTTSTDSYLVTSLENTTILSDGMMHLGLEHLEKARFTDLLPGLGPANESFIGVT
jgi:hypothetical protein